MCQDYCERLYLTYASRVDVKTIVLGVYVCVHVDEQEKRHVNVCAHTKMLGPKIGMVTHRKKDKNCA